MRWLTAATCCLIFGTGLMLAFAETAEEARMKLQGTWTAIKAERDGKAADDLVGHRLSFTGKSFQIQSKDGTPLRGNDTGGPERDAGGHRLRAY
jgi:hypothetical protein